MSSKKHVMSECVLCGEQLPIVDALTARFPCLTTCLRITNSKHLRGCHGEYLEQSERRAPLYFFAFAASSLSAIASLLTGNIFAAQLLGAVAAVSLIWGTIVRKRLIKQYSSR